MSPLRLILASLLHHWRVNLAVACGVAAGAAVLTGALLVGDSMRGSLRHLTLDRLGRIDDVLVAEQFFREQLAEELAAEPQFKEHFADAVPAILLRASLQNTDTESPRRANRVNLLGCDESFWRLGSGGPKQLPKRREIFLNQPLAERLGVKVGDAVLARLPNEGTIPADSPLGRRDETIRSTRWTVSEIVPAEGLGRFTLRPSQQLPYNAYISLAALQDRLDQTDRINAIFVAGDDSETAPSPDADRLLQESLRPTLEDFGLSLKQTPRGYFNVTSNRMLMPPAAVKEIERSLTGDTIQPALTYLANTIACGDREIPYSTITAVNLAEKPPLGPFLTPDGKPIPDSRFPIPDGAIVLNSWAADELKAKPGETIRVTYFEPESTHGRLREKTVELKLAAIAELTGAVADRDFTPEVPGVTNELSMADWDPPFPFDAGRIRPEDEKYWDNYGATPKAFVSPAVGRRLWRSRFGGVTSLRIVPPAGTAIEQMRSQLKLNPAALGFAFQPVKREGLGASSGATPFDVLFLCFSFFIIIAAMMLVALLFRLGIDRRASELGILAAVGFPRRKIARLLAGEGLCVAMLGSLLGMPLGVGYAALMLLGLQTWWLPAIVTPFLRLHVTATSLAVGFASGIVVALFAIVWAVRGTKRLSARTLLAGQTTDARAWLAGRSRYAGILAVVVLVASVLFGLLATRIGEEIQAGAFFGVGAMVLVAGLTLVWASLRSGTTGPAVAAGGGNLGRMALRNAARNPGRSTLTIGLVASACFLIVAVSAFHLDPSEQSPSLESGNGGFALVAESDRPIYQDLNTPDGRADLGFSEEDSKPMADAKTFALRVESGDDATCLNLYKPRQPPVLGLPKKFIDRGGFAWAASAASTPEEKRNPWLLLEKEISSAGAGIPTIPVVLEKNTATYMLHLYGGIGDIYEVTDGRGKPLRLKIVGLLSAGIFQGDLLISERDFAKHFPEVSGYRFFLIAAPPGKATAVQNALDGKLADYGLACETTGRRMAALLAVQNTYLSTFRSLGGLGLLLGTIGLAAVQLRNVLERRGELALLRATGFRRRSLAVMVIAENALLLLAGLGVGVIAALIAILPHLLTRAASIPWTSLAVTLAVVLAAGLAAGSVAVRATLDAPLLGALREER